MSSTIGAGATVSYALQSTKWYYKKAASDMGLHQKEPLFLGLWGAWLLTGSLFYGYAPDFELGFIKGFYMAINIGYSIGFGYPSDANSSSIWFSTFYVLIGASFVGVALGFFAEKITQDSETWFSRLQDQKKIEDFILLGNKNWKGRFQAWIYGRRSAIRAVFLWLVFIVILIIISIYGVGWTFREAQYFAISTLSTGGHWMIPEDSPSWLFAATGVLTMLGVPVMALAMAAVGQELMDQGSLEEAKTAINDPVTKEELQMLEDLGLQDGDGQIDLSEFILLCMVRIGTDPGLLTYIRQRFKELSVENADYLTIEEVTQNACTFQDGSVRRRASVMLMEQPPALEEDYDEDDEDDEDDHTSSAAGSVFANETTENGTTNNDFDQSLDDITQDLSNNSDQNQNNISNNDISNHSSKIPSDATTYTPTEKTETEVSDVEEGEVKQQSNRVLNDSAHSRRHKQKPLRRQVNLKTLHRQLTQSTVLQPNFEILRGSARPLSKDDDRGMALLDRSYVMGASEEKHLLQEARLRMKMILENAYHEEGWNSKGRIAGVKVYSKEGINGSPINMIKGVADLDDNFCYDFAASQLKYDFRNGDSVDTFYKKLDPTCVQCTIVATVGSALLDEDAREQCHVCWTAIKPPLGLVSERDACLALHSRRVKCPITGDPLILVTIFSIIHAAVPDTERALGRVRADAKMAGYIVRPSTSDKKHYQVTYFLHYDARGSLPVSVVNAFSVSQGLNAGRFRDIAMKQHQMALNLNNMATPLGCYEMKRLSRADHQLQLITEEEEDLWDLSSTSTRTFKFRLCVHAESPLNMRISTKDSDGMPLPFTLSRSEKSDRVGKKVAAGKAVSFGGKGVHLFDTNLLITVDGPLPKSITLRFQNAFWRHNKIYVPAIATLSEAEAPDYSNESSSMR